MIEYINWTYGAGFLGPIIEILFFVVVILGFCLFFIFLINQYNHSEKSHYKRTSMGAIKEKYARGEISKKEYLEITKGLYE